MKFPEIKPGDRVLTKDHGERDVLAVDGEMVTLSGLNGVQFHIRLCRPVDYEFKAKDSFAISVTPEIIDEECGEVAYNYLDECPVCKSKEVTFFPSWKDLDESKTTEGRCGECNSVFARKSGEWYDEAIINIKESHYPYTF